jgi:tripartite ATP-independent transporter DctM subunit
VSAHDKPLLDEISLVVPMPKRTARLVEIWVVSLILVAMVILPCAQAIARNLHAEIPGAAVFTQHLTLWVGFIGALLATGRGKHLALTTVELLPKGRSQLFARVFAQMIATATCALLAYASAQLMLADRGRTSTFSGGIPKYYSEIVMPVTLGLMALRFAWKCEGGWTGRILCVLAIGLAFALGHGESLGALTWPVAGLIFVGFLLGAPVFVAMAALAMLLFFNDQTPIGAVPTATFELTTSPTLPAIPLLTLAGYVLAEGGAARRLVAAFKGVFGWVPGGLAVMTVFVCAIFTTFTGASGVTILALGGLLLPSLLEDRYPEGFSVGLVTASGSLGLLFFPSLPVILYGVVAGIGVDDLFLGGLVPGIFMILLVAAYGVFTGVRHKVKAELVAPKEALKAVWRAKWDLGLPVIVLLAVMTGFATIVEAAGFAAAYALIVELVIYRDIHPLKQMPRVMGHAATLVGSVMILLGVALGLTGYLVIAQVPEQVVEWVTTHIHSPAMFLLALNVILLVLGSVLEIYSAIVVLAPLVAPLGKAYGIEPIHLGVVFLANLELGFLFPPMGLNLFLSASRFQKPLPYLYKKALPFLIIMSIGVLLITYVPALTTGVVGLFKH